MKSRYLKDRLKLSNGYFQCWQLAETKPNGYQDHKGHLSELIRIFSKVTMFKNWKNIFEKRASLLSKQLKQTWYDLQREDTSFLLDSTKHRDSIASGVEWLKGMKHTVFTANLVGMERQAKTDFADVGNRYFKKARFRITNQSTVIHPQEAKEQ